MKLGKNHDLLTFCDLSFCLFMLYIIERVARADLRANPNTSVNMSCKGQPMNCFSCRVLFLLFLAANNAPDIRRGISAYRCCHSHMQMFVVGSDLQSRSRVLQTAGTTLAVLTWCSGVTSGALDVSHDVCGCSCRQSRLGHGRLT